MSLEIGLKSCLLGFIYGDIYSDQYLKLRAVIIINVFNNTLHVLRIDVRFSPC